MKIRSLPAISVKSTDGIPEICHQACLSLAIHGRFNDARILASNVASTTVTYDEAMNVIENFVQVNRS
jgi:hypothetical protein